MSAEEDPAPSTPSRRGSATSFTSTSSAALHIDYSVNFNVNILKSVPTTNTPAPALLRDHLSRVPEHHHTRAIADLVVAHGPRCQDLVEAGEEQLGPKQLASVRRCDQRLRRRQARKAELNGWFGMAAEEDGMAVWFPAEYRPHARTTKFPCAHYIDKIYVICKEAKKLELDLAQLWQPGGCLYEASHSVHPPKLDRMTASLASKLFSATHKSQQQQPHPQRGPRRSPEVLPPFAPPSVSTPSSLTSLHTAPPFPLAEALSSAIETSRGTSPRSPASPALVEPTTPHAVPDTGSDNDRFSPCDEANELSAPSQDTTPHIGRGNGPADSWAPGEDFNCSYFRPSTRIGSEPEPSLDIDESSTLHPGTGNDRPPPSHSNKATSVADTIFDDLSTNACLSDTTMETLSQLIALSACPIGSIRNFELYNTTTLDVCGRWNHPIAPNYNVLLFPVHHPAPDHWTLAEAVLSSKGNYALRHYDSIIPGSLQRCHAESRALEERLPGTVITSTRKSCPTQSDETSCGVFVLVFLRCLLTGLPMPTHINASQARRNLLAIAQTPQAGMSSFLDDMQAALINKVKSQHAVPLEQHLPDQRANILRQYGLAEQEIDDNAKRLSLSCPDMGRRRITELEGRITGLQRYLKSNLTERDSRERALFTLGCLATEAELLKLRWEL